ncbi:NUDIX hydrolase [Glycomyces salinus]|uniref:NUDIX hydrolase n=1 Tax=Glycomyces salinus TaxID=980294 RepID=UPI001E3685A3|nr:NUDIX domain-containing protein [Glycomyces salinus]
MSGELHSVNSAEKASPTPFEARVLANVTADLVVLTVRENALKALLVVRDTPPFEGKLALPGGFVHSGEDLEQAALRRITEETGLDSHQLHFEQVRAYSAPGRDPRGRVVTVSFLAIAPNLPVPVAGAGAESADWYEVNASLTDQLAFDHDQILDDALERARSLLEHTTIAPTFCGEEFTLRELRRVYEIVWGMSLDNRNFQRKVTKAEGFIEPTGTERRGVPGRPAKLYARGPATILAFPRPREAPSQEDLYIEAHLCIIGSASLAVTRPSRMQAGCPLRSRPCRGSTPNRKDVGLCKFIEAVGGSPRSAPRSPCSVPGR